MTRRDWRAGELRLILAALIVAVAAVTSVGFLADRLRLALERDGAQLMGADVVLNSDVPLTDGIRAQAQARGLEAAETIVFPSMALSLDGEHAQLVSVKAVSPNYPLRGAVRVREPGATQARQAGSVDYPAQGVPEPGTVWLDASVLPLLHAEVGDRIQLGDSVFRVGNVITLEPDRGMSFVNLAPRLMMRADELAATGLAAFGSRLSYRSLFAGEPAPVADFTRWLRANLGEAGRIDTLATGRPEVRQTLDRAQRFLSLVAMLAVLIATVAVAMAARRYMLRHLASVAVMRCLGATQGEVSRLVAIEFLIVAVIGAALGCVLGYAGHAGLLAALGDLITTQLPAPTLHPAAQGLVTGVWLLLGFALPSLAQLHRVPPGRVLRSDLDALAGGRAALWYGVGLTGFVVLLWWVAGELRLGLLTAGGFLLAFAMFALAAWAGLVFLAPWRRLHFRSVAVRFALAGVVRRRAATVAQICALAVGLMAMLLLTITRTDLIDGWRQAAPPDAPNRFLINIQSNQREPIEATLMHAGIHAPLHPVVRGRLIEINGQPVEAAAFADRRARRMIEREANLSYSARLPEHNALVQGRWFEPDERAISMDQELAQTLGVVVGDTLTYDVAGRPVTAQLVNLRSPQWDSMAVNFFVLTSPEVLRNAPQSWITSFHIGPGMPDPLPGLLARFPNLSVFDVTAILDQVQRVLDQVIVAVQGLFVFTLAAGVLVLYAALSATRDERMREAALLRALGATRRQLARAQWLELALIGAAAGALAAIAASALAWALARYAFEFPFVPSWWVFLLGIGAGMLAALMGGQAGLRGVLHTPPLVTLREV
ncbi:FtsX-like permease family protein [Verticiella sediminum]|uniref:FtsX-like permease family protein n=2 Tax=Verticiella sediminum TaxID=1247510 RepID=A0A556A6N6_9BURK|nr:FtsX-like permease family protein [Verticiella sediminum]